MIRTKQIRRIEKGLNRLAVIASMVPFLGFTGTKTGMSKPFIVIEKSMSINPSTLVGGTREALTATAARLLTAIPIFWKNLKVRQ